MLELDYSGQGPLTLKWMADAGAGFLGARVPYLESDLLMLRMAYSGQGSLTLKWMADVGNGFLGARVPSLEMDC